MSTSPPFDRWFFFSLYIVVVKAKKDWHVKSQHPLQQCYIKIPTHWTMSLLMPPPTQWKIQWQEYVQYMYLKIWLDILVQISALGELCLKLTGVLGNLGNKMDRCIRRSSLNAGTILARVNSTLHPSGVDKMSTCHNGCFVKPWQIQKNEFRHIGWNFVIR